MRAYYLSKIQTDMLAMNPDDPTELTPANRHRFQVLAEEQGLNIPYQGGEIAVDASGVPLAKALLILVDTPNHSWIRKDPGMVPFPVAAGLDIRTSALTDQARTEFRGKAMGIGYTQAEVDAVWTGTAVNSMRTVLTHYGQANNPNFNPDDFDVTA